MRVNGLLGVVLLIGLIGAGPAWAQVPSVAVPTGVEVSVIAAVGDPVTLPAIGTRATAIAAALNCNLAATALPGGTLTNPTTWELTDPMGSAIGRSRCLRPAVTGCRARRRGVWWVSPLST